MREEDYNALVELGLKVCRHYFYDAEECIEEPTSKEERLVYFAFARFVAHVEAKLQSGSFDERAHSIALTGGALFAASVAEEFRRQRIGVN